MISKEYVCSYHTDCVKCSMKNLCVRASGISMGDRLYFLINKGFELKKTKDMQKGIDRHEAYQEGLPIAESMSFPTLRKKLFNKELIEFREFRVCSPYYGLRGILDIFRIQFISDTDLLVEIEELKSKYWKSYWKQLAIYGLILSDLKMNYVLQVKEDKRIAQRFYPINKKYRLNIKIKLTVFDQKPIEVIWMQNDMMTEFAKGISMAVLKRCKAVRRYHNLGIRWLSEIPPCKWCKNCSFYDRFCSKIEPLPSSRVKQRYFGKKQVLVKNKPYINLKRVK